MTSEGHTCADGTSPSPVVSGAVEPTDSVSTGTLQDNYSSQATSVEAGGSSAEGPLFDRKAYQREYMKKVYRPRIALRRQKEKRDE